MYKMRINPSARRALDADLERLRRDRVVVLELAELDDLVRDPVGDPLVATRGPQRAGVDDLAATLAAARRLPDELTVSVVLPAGAATVPAAAVAEAALHRRAGYLATVAWREGMAVRAMGLSQLPLGLTIAAASWVVATATGYLATQAEGVGQGLLAVTAMVAITIAWVVSWMVVESTMLDWRLGARRAAAYDLLSRAHLRSPPTVHSGQSRSCALSLATRCSPIGDPTAYPPGLVNGTPDLPR